MCIFAQISQPKLLKTNRLDFIDIVRSVAIIMMLEGHFMTLSLQPVFRDPENPIYNFWKFSRGITAPLFLSISGLIFTYLLLKNKTQGWNNLRVQKGFKRTGVLILLGYLLQFNLYTHFFGDRPLFTGLTQIFHVLQCIGLSLFLLISLYLFNHYILKISLGILLGVLGLLVFIISPTIYELDYQYIPRFVENILVVSKNTNLNTSVFPIFPWCGYVFMGGALGGLIVKLKDKAHHFAFPFGLIALGFIIKYLTYPILTGIQYLPGFSSLKPFQYEYEPVRFSQVLIFIGIIVLVQKFVLKIKEAKQLQMPPLVFHVLLVVSFALGCYSFTFPLETTSQNIIAYTLFFVPIVITLWKLTGWNYTTFLNIGQNTLSVYVFHVILLYQGFFGFKFGSYLKDNLNPFFAIAGAITFVFFFLAWTQYEPVLVNQLQRLKVRIKVVKRKIQYRTSSI
ncbi:Protein of unknown function [Wenyingzhuangia marina]|uniref:Heparan-alpha-glucosaminide N-acetyltransferase catalytic domain-containing protein n=1 Tax=Wenyingzhuangia marina TaxID=1195760 RepID=A0A1M5V7W3_9FLAO|nr:hypothetical protein GCM10011397_15940 [Wenyingzhuangia marina]SHH71300.1 Protein of unknown function [Wenyingzhuangia marina]